MYRILPLVLLLSMILPACEKSETTIDKMKVELVCYKGQYLNGIECNTLSAVEVLEPAMDTTRDMTYLDANGNSHEVAVGIVIPENFRDGEPFYFTVDSIYETGHHLQNCFYVPRYSARLVGISRIGCSATE